MKQVQDVKALMFDLFGTILDLEGSLIPHIQTFLTEKGADVSAGRFWDQWRARQRIEQFQDTIMMVGHAGYLETARRAFVYTLGLNGMRICSDEVTRVMGAWNELSPFPEVRAALARLEDTFKLAVLSNGDPDFLEHLVTNRLDWAFADVTSVTRFGVFKPHPAVYRGAARILGLAVNECLMVSANAFDVVGARACGLKAAFVNRHRLPYDDSPYRPNLTVEDFTGLANALL